MVPLPMSLLHLGYNFSRRRTVSGAPLKGRNGKIFTAFPCVGKLLQAMRLTWASTSYVNAKPTELILAFTYYKHSESEKARGVKMIGDGGRLAGKNMFCRPCI